MKKHSQWLQAAETGYESQSDGPLDSNVEYLLQCTKKGSRQLTINTESSSSACKLNVHKRCHKNVANNCGVNSKEMADVLKGMGLTGNKLSESMRVKKVCKLEHNPLAVCVGGGGGYGGII